jgi:serine/threonine protein kinase/energy-coupling factor transporter ATP-binding protein EcfA2
MRRHPLAIEQLVTRPALERRIGPFVLLQQLGHGGFAPVWAARETYEGTDVRDAAVKLFVLGRHSNLARDRLVREAQALCRVDHPHVVRFYSLIIDEPLHIGALAMELVAGQSLGNRVKESGPLDVADVLRVGLAVASALAEVHRAELLHRDVKPDNIVEADGTYKLIDFGIALPTDDEEEDALADDPGQTAKVGLRVTGTPGFVAPEYVRGEPPSVAGELYALGATLYMCLVGFPPASTTNVFPWDFDADVLEGRRPAPALTARAPEVSVPLAELITRLISPDPRERPPSASWVAERLQAMVQDSSRRTPVLPPEEVGPFRGLGRFEADDRDVFFGRDGEIGSVLELLRQRRLVVLVGPSGSGKSSLARAGILPRVTDGALALWPSRWDTRIVTPGTDPGGALLRAISTWLGHDVAADVECVVEALDKHVQREGRGLLLFLDPLEELVTLEHETTAYSRALFVELLVRLGKNGPEGIKVLGAARRDLLDSLLALPTLGKTLARSFVLVEPLPPAALRDVLTQALDVYGYSLEDETLVDELLDGVDQSANAMPLVAFVLTEAWRLRDTAGKRLTRAGLLAMGGVRGALEKHAENTLKTFVVGETEKRDAARRMLLGLTTLEGTRASKSLDKLRLMGGNHADVFVNKFVEARLCVPVEGGVTLAHEALITQWKRLAKWMEAARPARLVVAELERAARFWKTDPEVAQLLRGSRLERMEREVHSAEGECLSEDAWAYLVESLRRARQRRRWMWTGLVLISLAMFVGVMGQRWVETRATSAGVERGLQAPRENTAPVTSAVRVENEATPRELVVKAEVMASMSAKALESSKRVPLRSAVPRVSGSAAEAPVMVSSAEPVAVPEAKAPETSAPITTVVPSATATVKKRQPSFIPNPRRPDPTTEKKP